jgi:hypothetical protein
MNKDLFLAILSMDSYNRGYKRGVKFSPGEPSADINPTGTQIGNATILRDANDAQGVAKAAGFYALAYNVSTAGISGLSGTVISYRGTDAAGGLPWTSNFWIGDLLNGHG